MAVRQFRLDQEEPFRTWLATNPLAVVFWHGVDCEYSAAFAPSYPGLKRGAWALGERMVEHGAEGPVGDRYHLNLTPTLVCYRAGKEAARLEAAVGVGITAEAAQKWISSLR